MDAEKMMTQREIDNLRERLAIVERERDAAIMDMKVIPVCRICIHWKEKEASKKQTLEIPDVCIKCFTTRSRQFEWRGLCKENGGIE